MSASSPHNARLLDVRTPAEYQAVHIADSINFPLDQLELHAARFAAMPPGPLLLVCQSGSRARQARGLLERAGLADLHVLDGGVNGWLAAGRPVERGAPRMSLERQVRIVAGGLAALGGLLALTVHPWFAGLPLFVGSGLVFAGATDTCAMGMLLARLPFNRGPACDPDEAFRCLCPPAGAAS